MCVYAQFEEVIPIKFRTTQAGTTTIQATKAVNMGSLTICTLMDPNFLKEPRF